MIDYGRWINLSVHFNIAYVTPLGLIAYCPYGLRTNIPSESPTIIFATPTKVVSQSGPVVEYMGANRVPDLQKIFQASDEIPVHLKRGVPDRLLYRTTMALTVGGALYCLIALYIAAQPTNK